VRSQATGSSPTSRHGSRCQPACISSLAMLRLAMEAVLRARASKRAQPRADRALSVPTLRSRGVVGCAARLTLKPLPDVAVAIGVSGAALHDLAIHVPRRRCPVVGDIEHMPRAIVPSRGQRPSHALSRGTQIQRRAPATAREHGHRELTVSRTRTAVLDRLRCLAVDRPRPELNRSRGIC
jgi:hypothetical protein